MDTKNLIIRPATFSDCEFYAKWESSPHVSEFFSMDEDRNREQVFTEFIKDSMDETKLQFTIVLKETMEPIGKIYITKLNSKVDNLDITRIYIGEKEYRGKGYGEEALRCFLNYAFINLHMERVSIDYFTKNRIAASLYDKIGFSPEGIQRHATKKNGKYYDLQCMAMLRSEYYEKVYEQ